MTMWPLGRRRTLSPDASEELRSSVAVLNCCSGSAPLWRLWALFFSYAAGVALLVQLVILPHLFPAWDAGHGLLVGGDWITNHLLAVELSEKIHQQGWSAWELRPQGQAPAGIAAAVYVLTVPEPWTLIPINAALHATAALMLLRIVLRFVPEWRRAIWSVLPFLLYPSAMTWYTQILKDGYSIAGAIFFLYGWVLLGGLDASQHGVKITVQGVLWIIIGGVLTWIVRPYDVEIMLAVDVAFSLVVSVSMAVRAARCRCQWYPAAASILVIWMGVLALVPFTPSSFLSITSSVQAARATGQAAPMRAVPTASTPLRTLQPLPTAASASPHVSEQQAVTAARVSPRAPEPQGWTTTGFLPGFVEGQLRALARARDGFRTQYPDAMSNVDMGVSFHSVRDIIASLPRAAEVGVLAPFPNQWFAQGSLASTTIMRRVVVPEMLGVYFSLAFLPYAMWRWRRRLEIWFIIFFCGGMLLLLGVVVPNVGAIYRLRYGYLMTLVALGLAGFVMVVGQYRSWRLSGSPHDRLLRDPHNSVEGRE